MKDLGPEAAATGERLLCSGGRAVAPPKDQFSRGSAGVTLTRRGASASHRAPRAVPSAALRGTPWAKESNDGKFVLRQICSPSAPTHPESRPGKGSVMLSSPPRTAPGWGSLRRTSRTPTGHFRTLLENGTPEASSGDGNSAGEGPGMDTGPGWPTSSARLWRSSPAAAAFVGEAARLSRRRGRARLPRGPAASTTLVEPQEVGTRNVGGGETRW